MASTNYQMTPDELKTFNGLPGEQKGSYVTGLMSKVPATTATTAPTTPAAPTSFALPKLSDTQKSATDWINNSSSGQGGIDKYISDQVGRYTTAVQGGDKGLADRLVADSNRVGFKLPEVLDPAAQGIKDTADRELEANKAAIAAELAKATQARNIGLTQNQNLYDESMNKLGQSQAVQNQAAQELQNRRGGFYSGGLDYQLGGIASSINEQRGGLSRDLAARNADIIGRTTLDSETAAKQIAGLDAAQPGLIQSRIAEAVAAKQKAEAAARQQAGENDVKTGTLTGYLPQYNSYDVAKAKEQMAKNSALYASASPERQKQLHEENVALAASIGGKDTTGGGDYQFNDPGIQTIAGRNQDLNEVKTMADLTGYLPDGTPTSAQQKQQLAEEWTVSKNTGVITNTLADLYGIPRGTKTQDAIKQAADISVAQQNANTSSRNADISSARESRLAKGDTGGGGAKVSSAQFNDVYETLNKKYGVASYDDNGKVSYHNTTNPDQQALIVIDVLDAGMNDDQTLQLLNKLGITEAEAHKLLGG